MTEDQTLTQDRVASYVRDRKSAIAAINRQIEEAQELCSHPDRETDGWGHEVCLACDKRF